MWLRLALTLTLATRFAIAAEAPSDPVVKARSFSLNFGNTEDLKKALQAVAAARPIARDCAIPLLEIKGGDGKKIDPLAKPAGNANFDAISKPVPLMPCPSRVKPAQ